MKSISSCLYQDLDHIDAKVDDQDRILPVQYIPFINCTIDLSAIVRIEAYHPDEIHYCGNYTALDVYFFYTEKPMRKLWHIDPIRLPDGSYNRVKPVEDELAILKKFAAMLIKLWTDFKTQGAYIKQDKVKKYELE